MKNRIRLAGIDLDGTLLRSDKTISPATAEALKSAAARGIILVPVTGRPLSGNTARAASARRVLITR